MLKESSRAALRQMLGEMNVVDIAEEFDELEEEDVIRVFRILPKDKAAEVFSYLNPDVQQGIIEVITDREIGGIIDELFLDDAVDFIEEMPADIIKRVLANITPDRRKDINRFLKYPEDSAGSIMTIEYVDLKSPMTLADAFSYIQRTATDKETIYTCYVTDNMNKLIGIVSARTLLLADQESTVGDIMEPNVIFAYTHDDREELLASFNKYGFIAMPVVDNEEHLVGIITFDDVFTVQEEEITEDFEKMAAMSPSEAPYLETSIFEHVKHRVPWLMFLMIFAALTGNLVELYEDSLAVLPALVAFVPMLMNTGGNAGTQSSTMIIRGMALGELDTPDMLAVLWKELLVSLVCGAVLTISTYISVLFFGEGNMLAITVCLALVATIIMSNIIGSLLTFCAKVFKMDPAVMAAPLLTNIIDAGSLIVYFTLARIILHI